MTTVDAEAAAALDFIGAACLAAVTVLVGAADVDDAGAVGAVCAETSETQEDRRIEEKKCFMVRDGSRVILMGVYQGGLWLPSRLSAHALMHLYGIGL